MHAAHAELRRLLMATVFPVLPLAFPAIFVYLFLTQVLAASVVRSAETPTGAR
ncbi:MAG: hypothetical protein ICV64_00245 [Thermoleophilia bacterium]|nr:hypothetical protein [Thermoleophilia bacterium]